MHLTKWLNDLKLRNCVMKIFQKLCSLISRTIRHSFSLRDWSFHFAAGFITKRYTRSITMIPTTPKMMRIYFPECVDRTIIRIFNKYWPISIAATSRQTVSRELCQHQPGCMLQDKKQTKKGVRKSRIIVVYPAQKLLTLMDHLIPCMRERFVCNWSCT